MPSTRPDQIFDSNGACNACLSHDYKDKIDWDKRKDDLNKILKKAKLNKDSWNCIIPSSGGKDSTYQAIWAKNNGLNPLLVTATTCDLSEVGKKNIENLKNLGFDTIEFSTNSITRAKLNKISLETIGDIAWPEHVSIFTVPIKIAVNFKIPLIIYGENPQLEYGGPKESLDNSTLDKRWMEEFGGLIGLRVNDLVENYEFKNSDLSIFKYPDQEELEKLNLKSLFLGYYEKWDSLKNYEVAKNNGFQNFEGDLEGCYFNWEKIDNYQHGIHDYFKFIKFGFGRATDQLCYLIRKKKITRDEAIKISKKLEGKFPISYMKKPLNKILNKIDLSLDDFKKICEKFTNKKIFKTDQGGNITYDDKGNLIRKI
jgi:N-acetyl sugar amidotransferase